MVGNLWHFYHPVPGRAAHILKMMASFPAWDPGPSSQREQSRRYARYCACVSSLSGVPEELTHGAVPETWTDGPKDTSVGRCSKKNLWAPSEDTGRGSDGGDGDPGDSET